MNLKKILSGVVAGAMALSAMSVAAFAEGETKTEKKVVFSGSRVVSDSSWWTEAVIVGDADDDGEHTIKDLIGDTDPGKVVSITFSSDIVFQVGYNNTAGDWSQQKDEKTYTLTDIALEHFEDEGGGHDPALKFGISMGDGKEYTINWEVEAEVEVEPENPTEEGLETALYVGNSVDWITVKSDSVNISIGKDFTYSISGLDIAPDKLTVIYIKDVAVENEEAEKSDIDPVKVTFTSVKINGNEVAVKEGVPTGLNKSGVFDIALFNVWGDNFIDLPEENINSVEISVKIEEADDEPAPAEDTTDDEPAPADETTADETTADETTADEAPADETTAAETLGNADNNAASSSGSGAPENQPTGIAIAIVPAALAAAGIIISKKRK